MSTAGYHTYGPTCRLAAPLPSSASAGSDSPPPIRAQFFHQSALPIDDPLSPLPPPATASPPSVRYPLQPFAGRDNAALEEAWLGLDTSVLREGSSHLPTKSGAHGAKEIPRDDGARAVRTSVGLDIARSIAEVSAEKSSGEQPEISRRQLENTIPEGGQTRRADAEAEKERLFPSSHKSNFGASSATDAASPSGGQLAGPGALSYPPSRSLLEKSTTGTPFVRAPLRVRNPQSPLRQSAELSTDPETAGEDVPSSRPSSKQRSPPADRKKPGWISTPRPPSPLKSSGSEKVHRPVQVAVGISRLHVVEFPDLDMKPIYWSPLNDISAVGRGTWFYRDTMLPVEANVANRLELGYQQLRPWTETWNDELNSAVAVGAEGEAKVLHRLWPKPAQEKHRTRRQPGGRPAATEVIHSGDDGAGATSEEDGGAGAGLHVQLLKDIRYVAAEARAEIAKDKTRRHSTSSVVYKNHNEAFILRPGMLPSAYYGRRPVAKIRKGVTVGLAVVRGFDWRAWHKINPAKMTVALARAWEGAAASASGTADAMRASICPACWALEQPQKVSDLILVIHGIGQKLSERIESFHFTHLVNSLRRQIHVELGTSAVRSVLRPGHVGIMTLPINWRSTLSFEEGGPPLGGQSEERFSSDNDFSLKDITPSSLPAVRNLITDVMLDIPYYLSHHKPKMIEAVVREANRVYRLWCKNNAGFEKYGRVHLVAHSLGSVMALDILSKQPTQLPRSIDLDSLAVNDKYFDFDTTNLFLCGSPAGFFVLLNRASLLPRKGRDKPGADGDDVGKGIAGDAGTYGCLAIDNIYNILHQLDPIAYRLNAAVDKDYAASLKPAFVPSASISFFATLGNAFRFVTPGGASSLQPGGGAAAAVTAGVAGVSHLDPSATRPNAITRRLPSTIELDIHDFSREEIAERRMFLLNENGQLDFLLPSNGGPLEIQYLNMLGAHSSYWASRDFVRFLVLEVGRVPGRDSTVAGLRAVKKGYNSRGR